MDSNPLDSMPCCLSACLSEAWSSSWTQRPFLRLNLAAAFVKKAKQIREECYVSQSSSHSWSLQTSMPRRDGRTQTSVPTARMCEENVLRVQNARFKSSWPLCGVTSLPEGCGIGVADKNQRAHGMDLMTVIVCRERHHTHKEQLRKVTNII